MSTEDYWMSCVDCGVMFGITRRHEEQLRSSGCEFWCPNGHSMSFGDSVTEKVKQLTREVAGRDKRIRNYQDRIAHLTQRTRAYEGAAKRRQKLMRAKP